MSRLVRHSQLVSGHRELQLKSERGAMLIMVAVCLLALTLLSAVVVDYGILWTSRRQAQNSADSAAMGAAITMLVDPTKTDEAKDVAHKLASENAVWAEYPKDADVLVDLPITCPPGTGGGVGCVRVDVQRGQTDRNGGTHTNKLPTLFAQLAGISSQAIMATATAQVISGNSVRCLKPWAVPDRWNDFDEAPKDGSWNQMDTFTPPTDTYSMPGFKNPQDDGTEIVLKSGNTSAWSAGWMQEIDWGQTGSNVYRTEIATCPSWIPDVGIYDGTYKCDAKNDTPDPEKGCISVKTGTSQGPTTQGVSDLVNLDPAAHWDGTKVVGGCGDTPAGCGAINPTGYSFSPRIVPVSLFNPQAFYNESCSGGTGCVVQVSNLIGFFVEGMCSDVYTAATMPAYCGPKKSDWDKNLVGIIMKYPGSFDFEGGPTTSSFTQFVRLVR
jgi:Flp pilus assembly protein TadG